jgi:ferredoxin
MKVRIDSEICAGFGICLGIIPEIVALHDDGYAIVLDSEVKPEDEDAVRRAASRCPARAIFVSEESESE